MSDIFALFNSVARETLVRVAILGVVAVRDVLFFLRVSTEREGAVVRATVVVRFVCAGTAERCFTAGVDVRFCDTVRFCVPD